MEKTVTANKRQLLAATVSVMLCQAVYMFYVTARSVVLPSILSDLNGMAYYSITVILSSMAMAAITPAAGKLGDMFGRKRVYLIGLVGYCCALTGCALAPGMAALMISIACCGITYGLIYTQLMALLVDVYSADIRPRMLSYASVVSSVASLLGPVVGGLCADFGGWRLVFLIMIPFAALNLVCAWFGMPDVAPVASSNRVDYLGTVLFMLCIMPFLYTLTSAGNQFAWRSATTCILLGVSAASLVLLLFVETRAQNPIIPLPLFRDPAYVLCLLVAVGSALCYSASNYLPVFYQVVKGMSNTMSGMMATPRQISMVLCSLAMGSYIAKKKNFKYSNLIPMLGFCIGMALMSRYTATTAVAVICIAEIFYGGADSSIVITNNAMGQHYLSKKDMGSGLAFIGFISTLGTSLGSAVTGCIISHYWNARRVLPAELYQALSPNQLSMLTSATALKDSAALASVKDSLPTALVPAFDQSVQSMKAALNTGIQVTFTAGFVLCVVIVIAVLMFRWNKYKPAE